MNRSEPFDGRIELAVDFDSAAHHGPAHGRIGLADLETAEGKRLRLQLAPGQTVFVKTYRESVDAPVWHYRELAGEPTPLDGMWAVEFIEGGPELPPPFEHSPAGKLDRVGRPERRAVRRHGTLHDPLLPPTGRRSGISLI